jgi:hypothetical protein
VAISTVAWLVEVQENFELNHETLYLAVKLVDTYLSKQIVTKEVMTAYSRNVDPDCQFWFEMIHVLPVLLLEATYWKTWQLLCNEVKLVDTYLSKQIVTKEVLQLVGAASLFLACKFDVRFC